jgi:hypothetical protein
LLITPFREVRSSENLLFDRNGRFCRINFSLARNNHANRWRHPYVPPARTSISTQRRVGVEQMERRALNLPSLNLVRLRRL